MRNLILYCLLLSGNLLQAEEIKCPSTHQGKKLTDAAFFEWTSASSARTMANDRKPLEPNDSRIEGDDWYQIWDVTQPVKANGLQMVCKYQGVPAGLFIEIKKNVSSCTLTKKSGVVTVGCK